MKTKSFFIFSATILFSLCSCSGQAKVDAEKFLIEATKASEKEFTHNYATATYKLQIVEKGIPGEEDANITTKYTFHYLLEEKASEEGSITKEWVCQDEIPEEDEDKKYASADVIDFISADVLHWYNEVEKTESLELNYYINPLKIELSGSSTDEEEGVKTAVKVIQSISFNSYGKSSVVTISEEVKNVGQKEGQKINTYQKYLVTMAIEYSTQK